MTSAIRVLAIHNHYRLLGGEDRVFDAETRLLEANGDDVVRYTARNEFLETANPIVRAKNAIWNSTTYREVRSIIKNKRPDVMHAHNTFPMISPAAHAAASDEGIPVVQTLHNFRLICANGLLRRDGRICEDCVGKSTPWRAVVHKCYRNGVAASAVTASMLQYHRWRRTWNRNVDIFVAPTEFARHKFIEASLPASKIFVKPHFVDWEASQQGTPSATARDRILFVGRLSEEKGIRTLLAAWHDAGGLLPLHIVGDGPLRGDVQQAAALNPRIEWLGFQPPHVIQVLLTHARALIVPSEFYEMFGLVVIEAYSMGTPVIGSRLGGFETLIEDHVTGLHFVAGDSSDLREKASWASANPHSMAKMGTRASALFEDKYTPAINYDLLRRVYARAAAARSGSATYDPSGHDAYGDPS